MLLKRKTRNGERGTGNGERGTGNGGNEKLEQNRELDVKLLIAVGFKLVFFFNSLFNLQLPC